MKVTTSWIQSYLRRTISDHEIVESLERAGFEVEQFSSSKALDPNIVIAKVQNVRQHPEADRLHIAEVFDGTDTFEIVCGAPNIRTGLVVPLARIGVVLPSGDVISQAKLRGVTSNGMLCSGRELELSDDHDGLLELDSEATLGASINSIYPADGLIDMKTAANRWDALSVLGLAREVSGQTKNELNELPVSELLFDSKTNYIDFLEPSVSRFCITELKLGARQKTPDWMIQRLTSAGVRTLGLIVDITNYVMLEYGQPMHAYDADKVALPFGARKAHPKEKLTTLDEAERDLDVDDLVICDADRGLGLAGVMGGLHSEVTDGTKRIYLEAATFEPGIIRKSAKRHGLRSDASARFERGLPVQLAPVAMARAIDLFVEYAGAKVVGGQDKLQIFPYEYRIGLRTSYASKYLGIDLDAKKIVETLNLLGIEARQFDIVAEAKKHLNKPYAWGASFRKSGDTAFDCSYLTDYLYSLIGLEIGHTSLGQYEIGRPVTDNELLPGDILFYRGKDSDDAGDYDLKDIDSKDSSKQPHSIKGHYYMSDQKNGGYTKIEAKTGGLVGHNGLYIGDGKVIHAAHYEYVDGEWKALAEPRVMEVSVEYYTTNPTYLGARRYVDTVSDYITVKNAPWWRSDLKLEEDLLEELARLVGYDKIPSTIPAWHPQEVQFDRRTQPERRIRQLLSGLGLYEVMTYSFVSEEQITRLGEETSTYLKLKNPLSSEQAYLRRNLATSHMSVLEQNRKVASEVGFYEISGVFHDRGDELPDEPTMIGVTVAVPHEAYRYVKGIWDQLSAHLGLDFQLLPFEGSPYAKGRAVSVMVRGKSIGTMGQMTPTILRTHKLDGEVARFELDLGALLEASKTITYDAPSRYPAANRDMTILVPMTAQWQKIDKALNNIVGVTAHYGGDYYSDSLPVGYRSLTIHLELSAMDHTLDDAEVLSLMTRIEQLLEHTFKAKNR
jgi:phenylalanyl-tRNA synthetase beta subunit